MLCSFATLANVVASYDEQDSYGGGDEHGGGGGGGGHEGDDYGGGGGGGHGGGGYGEGHAIDAAVNSKHSVDTYEVKTHSEQAKTPVVDINSGPLSLKIRYPGWRPSHHTHQFVITQQVQQSFFQH